MSDWKEIEPIYCCPYSEDTRCNMDKACCNCPSFGRFAIPMLVENLKDSAKKSSVEEESGGREMTQDDKIKRLLNYLKIIDSYAKEALNREV